MDGPSPLASNGIPYAFTSFDGAGRLTPNNEQLFETGGPANIDAQWHSGPHRTEIPLDLQVIDIPEK